ncbi:carboxypeptidase regulatory-like domain-containing protein [Streptomyces sp. NPDC056161]|uniref:carboxypeptidase regulatory-like domain-containing protein n=1 Tax=Streptomyces sp. NPDC056161 TaxID=3345732 RepID=UPI0035D6EAFE
MIEGAAAVLPHPRRLIAVGPYHRGDGLVAIRVGVSVSVPLAVLWATGHLDLSLYSTFGSFTALYGRVEVQRVKLGIQALAGATFTASVLIGLAVALSADRTWLVVPILALWSGVITVLSDAVRLHPPGSLLQAFAVGACSVVPSTPRSLGTAALVCAGAALFAIAATTVAGLHRPERLTQSRAIPTPGLRHVLRQPGVGGHLVRCTLAPAAAGAISTASGMGHPYWAAVTAVVPMAAPSTPDRVLRAGHRVIGTFVGLAVAGFLLQLGLNSVGAIILVAVFQVLAELSVSRNYSMGVVFITTLALMMIQLVRPSPVHVLLRDRAVETVVGIAVAVVFMMVTHNGSAPPHAPPTQPGRTVPGTVADGVAAAGSPRARTAAPPSDLPRSRVTATAATDGAALRAGAEHQLRGTVADTDGTPVDRAALTLIDPHGHQVAGTLTDSSGRYGLAAPAAGSYVLVTSSGTHQPQASTVTINGPSALDLVLTGSTRLHGSVSVSGPGTPVAGAAVTLTDVHGEVLASALTGADGGFALPGPSAGSFTLVVSAENHRPTATTVTLARNAAVRQDVELLGNALLTGTARSGSDGRPVREARIMVVDPDGRAIATALTGADGGYTVEGLPPGDYTIIATGYPPAVGSIRVTSAGRALHDVEFEQPPA